MRSVILVLATAKCRFASLGHNVMQNSLSRMGEG